MKGNLKSRYKRKKKKRDIGARPFVQRVGKNSKKLASALVEYAIRSLRPKEARGKSTTCTMSRSNEKYSDSLVDASRWSRAKKNWGRERERTRPPKLHDAHKERRV